MWCPQRDLRQFAKALAAHGASHFEGLSRPHDLENIKKIDNARSLL